MTNEEIIKLKNMSITEAKKFLENKKEPFEYFLGTIWVKGENKKEYKITYD
jgi:hypothetical protein